MTLALCTLLTLLVTDIPAQGTKEIEEILQLLAASSSWYR